LEKERGKNKEPSEYILHSPSSGNSDLNTEVAHQNITPDNPFRLWSM